MLDFESNYGASDHLTACRGIDGEFDNFSSCDHLDACFADAAGSDASAVNYTDCSFVGECESNNSPNAGYRDCAYVLGCESTGDSTPLSGANTKGIDSESNNFQHVNSPAQLTADADDLDLGYAPTQRLDSDALGPWTISGILFSDDADQRSKRLINVSANPILIGNEDAASAAANRIRTGTGGDLTLGPDAALDLWQDIVTNRWRVVQA